MLPNHSETPRKKGAVLRPRRLAIGLPMTQVNDRPNLEQLRLRLQQTDCALGEWIRDVILRELRKGSASDPSLAEILGVRLLLVNVLRPLAAGQRLTPEAFDKLLDEISDAKHQLAAKLATPGERK